MTEEKTKTKKAMGIFKTVLALIFVVFVVEEFGYRGAGGLLILMFIFATYKLITNRKQYLIALQIIETQIWGKPLDKRFWKKNEWKNTKVKIVWKKKE